MASAKGESTRTRLVAAVAAGLVLGSWGLDGCSARRASLAPVRLAGAAGQASPAAAPLRAVRGLVAVPAGLVAANSGRFIGDNAAGFIGDNAAGLVSGNSGGLVSGNSGGLISSNAAGRRVLAAGWEPLAGVRVLVVDLDGRPLPGVREAVTDGTGAFSLQGLPPGLAVLRVPVGRGALAALLDPQGLAPVEVSPASTLVADRLRRALPVEELRRLPAARLSLLAGEVRAGLEARAELPDLSTHEKAAAIYEQLAQQRPALVREEGEALVVARTVPSPTPAGDSGSPLSNAASPGGSSEPGAPSVAPVTPAPGASSAPANPSAPGSAPTTPTSPGAPTTPTSPGAPTTPTSPGAPTTPTSPGAPASASAAPSSPGAPTTPTSPGAPTTPTSPGASTHPSAPHMVTPPPSLAPPASAPPIVTMPTYVPPSYVPPSYVPPSYAPFPMPSTRSLSNTLD